MRIEADVKIFRRSLGPVLACAGRGPRNTATKQITLETRNGRVFAYGDGTGVFVTSQLAAVTPDGVRETCSVCAKDFLKSLKAATGEKITINTTRQELTIRDDSGWISMPVSQVPVPLPPPAEGWSVPLVMPAIWLDDLSTAMSWIGTEPSRTEFSFLKTMLRPDGYRVVAGDGGSFVVLDRRNDGANERGGSFFIHRDQCRVLKSIAASLAAQEIVVRWSIHNPSKVSLLTESTSIRLWGHDSPDYPDEQKLLSALPRWRCVYRPADWDLEISGLRAAIQSKAIKCNDGFRPRVRITLRSADKVLLAKVDHPGRARAVRKLPLCHLDLPSAPSQLDDFLIEFSALEKLMEATKHFQHVQLDLIAAGILRISEGEIGGQEGQILLIGVLRPDALANNTAATSGSSPRGPAVSRTESNSTST